mgnify:CR=1 FL=1
MSPVVWIPILSSSVLLTITLLATLWRMSSYMTELRLSRSHFDDGMGHLTGFRGEVEGYRGEMRELLQEFARLSTRCNERHLDRTGPVRVPRLVPDDGSGI